MPVYNEKKDFLKNSIESILNQSLKDFEFLIIDDGSNDESCLSTLEIYAKKDPRITLIHNKQNIGLTKTLNKGLRLASGKLIARADSDDLSHKGRLEKQLHFMQQNPDYALCGSWANIINDKDEKIGIKKFHSTYEDIRKNILLFNFFTHSSLFFKKDTVLELGGYDETMLKAQDYDLLLKIIGRNKVANIPEFLCSHRIQNDSISAQNKKRQEWYGLIARFRAITKYGFPKAYFFKTIPSLFYFLFVPHFIEKQIFKILWKK